MQPPRRQLLSRPMGNAQSRQTALGQAPQYGATTNPNGAQTASRMTIGGQPVQRVDPSQDQFSPEFQLDYQSPAMYDARAIGQRSRASQPDQSPAAATQQPVPATAPYAGGDVAGQAQYYRQTALQGYRAPAGSAQQSAIVGALPGVDMRSPQYSPLNGYDGYTAGYNDPLRMRPDQKFQSALGAAQRGDPYDPTNQGGNRFAGSANRILANQASDQAAIAAGTQAERERMQGIAQNSDARAMDPNSQSRQFAYENSQGQMVATNRLGQLQQLQKRFPDDPEVAISVAEEKQRQSALGQKQEDQRERRRAASSDGLTDRERRTLGYRNQVANNAMSRGILPKGADPDRPGFSHQERIARNNQEAADKSSFRSSETKLRRSAINAANQNELNAAAARDNSRLPSGQLSDAARNSAKNDIAKLFDPNARGTSRDQFHGQVVRDVGLTGDPKKDTPSAAVSKIFESGISTPEQAIALQKYWKAMSRSNSEWIKGSDKSSPLEQQRITVLNEMAEVPPEEMYNWFEQNKDRLVSRRSEYENPIHRTNPDSGYLRDNMPYQMFN